MITRLPYSRYTRGIASRCAALLVLALAPAQAQVDRPAFERLREGLSKLRPMRVAISGQVACDMEVVGDDPHPARPSYSEAGLKGKAVSHGGIVSGRRTYAWLWNGDRWRVRETFDVAGGARVQDSRSDGKSWFDLSYPEDHTRAAQGFTDRARGSPTTPATFAYMPNAVWAEELLASMKLQTVRAIPDAIGHGMVECRGSAHNRVFRLVFDPSRRYAITECSSEGSLYASEERATAWSEVGGWHIPVAMEQRMRTGPSLRDAIWFVQRIRVSNLKALLPSSSDFQPEWPEGARIVNVPEGKMYQYTDGRMKFLMHVGGMTPQRRLLGWGVVAGVPIAGLLVLRLLTRRRRGADPASALCLNRMTKGGKNHA